MKLFVAVVGAEYEGLREPDGISTRSAAEAHEMMYGGGDYGHVLEYQGRGSQLRLVARWDFTKCKNKRTNKYEWKLIREKTAHYRASPPFVQEKK